MISEIDDVVQWWRVIEWPDSLCLKHLCALRRPSSRMDSAFVADRKAATSNQHGVYRNDNVSHVCSSDLQLLYLNAWRISKPRFDIQTYQKTSNGAGWLLGSRSAIEPRVINCWLKKDDFWGYLIVPCQDAKMPRCRAPLPDGKSSKCHPSTESCVVCLIEWVLSLFCVTLTTPTRSFVNNFFSPCKNVDRY